MKSLPFLMGLCVVGVMGGASAEVVSTTDGRRVELREDGTYSFIKEVFLEEYQVVDIVDLEIDSVLWNGRRIKLRATINNDGTGVYQHTSMTGVMLSMDPKLIPNDERRKMLKICSVICRDVEVKGIFRSSKLGRGHLVAENVRIISP